MLRFQVAHQRQGALVSHLGGERECGRQQVAFLFHRHELVEQLLARHGGEHLGLHGLATHDEVERRFHAQHPGQPLCATRPRDQPEFHFGQRHQRARGDKPVVATQGQLQAAAHADGVNSRTTGLLQFERCITLRRLGSAMAWSNRTLESAPPENA